jgi:hypothetical protein
MANFEKIFVYKIISQTANKTVIQPLRIISGSTHFTEFLSSVPAKERKHIKFFLTSKSSLDPDIDRMTLKQAIRKFGIKLDFNY